MRHSTHQSTCTAPAVDAANAAIRDYVRNHGRRTWSRHHREELARLHRRWLEATRAVRGQELGAGLSDSPLYGVS